MELIDIINKQYKLTKKDCKDLESFSVRGMKFHNTHSDAKGFGSVSTMNAKGMLGLMKMESIVINPFQVDAPLLSVDRIRAMGNDMIIMEMYDTMLSGKFDISEIEKVGKEYTDIPDCPTGENWYDDLRVGTVVRKKTSKKESKRINELAEKYLTAYLSACKKAPKCDETKKRRKAAVYSEGLLENGGPATDPVVKSIGKEKTTEFFRKILFATDKD